MACDKTNKPLILSYDNNDKINGLQQASGIELDSILVGTVSATTYLNTPTIGGITSFSGLDDTPNNYGSAGQVLITSGDGIGFSSISIGGGGGVTDFSALNDTPDGYGVNGQIVITSGDGIGYSSVDFAAPGDIITDLTGLSDTPGGYGSPGQFLQTDGAGTTSWATGAGGGATEFSALNDTPSNYGSAGQILITSGDGIGFSSIPLITDDVSAIQFDLTATVPHSEGTISWNDDDKTLDIHTEVTNTKIQVGQEEVIRVNNQTGSTLTNGSVVYINGAQGNRPTVALASASATSADKTLAIITADLADNSTGYATTFGLVRDLNTAGYAAGTELFLDTTPGGFTDTGANAPNHRVSLGVVVTENATEGVILFKVFPGTETTALHDVDETPATITGQQLVWDNSASKWVVSSVPLGASSFLDLPDTPASYGSIGQILSTNGFDSLQWNSQSSFNHNDFGGLTTGDPHTQYSPIDASRAYSAAVSGQDPTLDNHLSTKGYVDGQVSSFQFQIIFDGGGSVIAGGTSGWVEMPYNGQFQEWRLTADQTGSCSIDVLVDSYANFPPTTADSVVGGQYLAISSAIKAEETDIPNASWDTTTFSKGDFVNFHFLGDTTSITKLNITMVCSRT